MDTCVCVCVRACVCVYLCVFMCFYSKGLLLSKAFKNIQWSKDQRWYLCKIFFFLFQNDFDITCNKDVLAAMEPERNTPYNGK